MTYEHIDRSLGHVTIHEDYGQYIGHLTDMGRVVQISYNCRYMTPHQARAIGQALIGWADRKDAADGEVAS